MPTATLSHLVTMVRAEAGHALSAAQGLNAVETIKHLIRRTEEELWTAFEWPELMIRKEIPVGLGQYEYMLPQDVQFDQVRQVWFAADDQRWQPVKHGIPEDLILADDTNSATGDVIQLWDHGSDKQIIRVWPTPQRVGTLRFKGIKPLNCLCEDTDCCTLDATLIAMRTAYILLLRAKAADAEMLNQSFQRHLQKLMGNKVSHKNKVTTFGTTRGAQTTLRPYLDYIPS